MDRSFEPEPLEVEAFMADEDEADDDWLALAAAGFARDDQELCALRRLTRKAFLGSLLAGAAAGALGALEAGAPAADMIALAFFGALAVMLGGFLGGLASALLRAFAQYARRGLAENGDASFEGAVLGGFAGAFCALLGCLALWSLPWAYLAAGLGAMAGAFLGALPGRMVGTLMAMLAVAEMAEPAMTVSETSQTEQAVAVKSREAPKIQ